MKRTTLVLCLAVIVNSFQKINTENVETPLVKAAHGQIRGSILTTRFAKTIYAFRGIRYAKAPINELRFQPPQPPEKWDGVYNATQDGPSCPQPRIEPTSEDCLYINVYTTKLPKKNEDNPKRPVIVYIHQGNFYSSTGRSNWIGPQYLMDQDVVLVTFNYRIGALGFISTGDKEAPGNLGLKDQVQALKWVKENILHFGGSPDSVTIYGYDAGSVSVMLHMLSPLTKGLFHRAIASSGSALHPWPWRNHQLDLAKKQAKLVGCPDDTSANIMKCLKTKPAEELGRSIDGFKEFGNDPITIWEPVIEMDFGQERYLKENPVQLVLNGQFEKVPLMTGITTDEYGYAAFHVVKNSTLLDQLEKEFETYAPIAFGYERKTEKSKSISKEIKKLYFGDKPLDDSSLAGVAQLYSDGLVGFGINRAAKAFSEKSDKPVYYYRFNYKSRYSHFSMSGSNAGSPYGVVHQDDLIYMFYISTAFREFTDSDPESPMVDKMTTMWANFARTGNPVPETSEKLDSVKWEPFTKQNGKYLDIGNKLGMKANLFEKRYDVWEKILPLQEAAQSS